MTGHIKPLRKAIQKVTPKEVYAAELSHYATPIFKPEQPDIPQPPPVPTIDDAAQDRANVDRLRRRRGVYANIFAGNASAPAVGKATLGG